MDKIAFISGDTFIYWSPIIMALSAVAAVAFYCAVYVAKDRKPVAAAFSACLSIVLSIPLARLVHWYCRTPSYESFQVAMTDYSQGGYALAGVFFGCLLAAGITRLLCISRNLPKMLDAMAIGGGIGIALGCLASLFNTAARGMILPEDVGFPFAYPLINAVSGAAENRLATFMIQSILVGAIVVLLLGYMLVNALRKKKIADGDIFLIFLLAYGAVQAICDSTRSDSLFLRSNGFVSIVQILGLGGLLIPVIVFSVRMVMHRKFKFWQIPLWLGIAGLLGLAGYMEYYVQRNGHKAVFAYSTMGASLFAVILLGLLVRWLGREKE